MNFFEKNIKKNYLALTDLPTVNKISSNLAIAVLFSGLMIVIFTLIGILYKMGSRARQQRELHDRLHSISQFLGKRELHCSLRQDKIQ